MKKIVNFILIFSLLITVFSVNTFSVFASSCTTYEVSGYDGKKYCMPENLIGTSYEQRFKNVVASGVYSPVDKEMFERIADKYGNKNYVGSYLDFVFSGGGVRDSVGVFACLLHGDFKNFKGCNQLVTKSYKNDSGNRHYFRDKDTNNNYKDGDTRYYNIVNSNQNMLKIENKSVYYNDVDYRVYNNTYNYYTTENTYNIKYESNYTYIQNFGVDGHEVSSQKYYFKLPDGRNSFNLTDEQVQGYKLDYKVENYKNVSDIDGVEALFHLDGNYYNSAINQSITFDKQSGADNFLSNNTSFKAFLNIPNSSVYQFGINNNSKEFNNFTLEFRYYVSSTDSTGQISNSLFGFFDVSTPPVVNGSYNFNHVGKVALTGKNNIDYYITTGIWHHIALSCSSGSCNTFIDGEYISTLKPKKSFFPLGNSGFYFNGGNVRYAQIDEIRLTSKSLYNSSFSVPVAPFDTNIVYTLPETETNNKILIQSPIRVSYKNDIRFGSIRPSLPKRGDIYINFDSNNLVTSIQQYTGVEWIEVPASYYNAVTEKWENLIGTSIMKDKEISPDNPGNSPGDSPGSSGNGISESFLEKWFSLIILAIKDISGGGSGSNFWDFLIESIKSIPEAIKSIGEAIESVFGGLGGLLTGIGNLFKNIINSILELFGGLANFLKWVFEKLVYLLIPSNEFWENLQVPDFKTNLGILFAPFELIGNLISKLFDFNKINNSSFVLEWQDIKFNNVILIKSSNFNFVQFINSNPDFKKIYDIYLNVIDGIVFFGLLNLIRLKSLSFLKR